MPTRPSNRLTPEELELWRALIRLSQLLPAALEAGLGAADESLPRYEILAVLATHGEGLRLTELGRFALVSKPRLSVHVASLEADGYVSRAPHPDDARASLVTLTPAGRRHLAALTPGHLELARQVALDHVAPADREPVLRSLASMLAALGDSWTPGARP
ncbi:MAG: MarR family transcriptional regulator [Myxococcaceae bacterium]|jgi:DNA-binding MarR family transcriptional regulator|nr:MarR family transcriptional regulator [Myxococcaceae bacterium]